MNFFYKENGQKAKSSYFSTKNLQKRTFLPIVAGWLGYTAVATAWTAGQVIAVGASVAVASAVVVGAAVANKSSNQEPFTEVVKDSKEAKAQIQKLSETLEDLHRDRNQLSEALGSSIQEISNQALVLEQKDKVINQLVDDNSRLRDSVKVLASELGKAKSLNGRIESVTKGIATGTIRYFEQVDRNQPPLLF